MCSSIHIITSVLFPTAVLVAYIKIITIYDNPRNAKKWQ